MEVLQEFVSPIIMGACLGIGFMVKPLGFINSKYIPLIMGLLGIMFNVMANQWSFGLDVLLAGMASGLASTGLFELGSNLVSKEPEEKPAEE